VQTFTGTSAPNPQGNILTRLLEGAGGDADVRVVLPTGFSPISVARYGTERMKKSVRDMAWFLRYVGYAVVAGDPSILRVNTRGLRDVLEKGCSLAATNVALQEMRAGAAELLKDLPEARKLLIESFNVLIEELAVPTPSARQRLGSPENQGLQLPAIYALAAQGKAPRFTMKPAMTGAQKAEVVRAAYRQVFERDIAKAYSQVPCPVEASQVSQGQISMREFIRALGHSKDYQQQFFGRFANSRVVELAFRHFLGRGISSREEFTRYFDIVSAQGLKGLVDALINSLEYARVFGEETVPYLRDIGEEAQESAGWGSNRKLFRFSAPFEGAPQYVTLYASYRQPFADQHPYGGGNDPLGLSYGAIFPSGTASVSTRPAPLSYDTRRILVGNGMRQPGQMNSPQFRASVPRRLGPKVVRLQQIATGGASVPRRGGQPSIRNTEASTQAVIQAVYVQILGNSGYAGERVCVAENKLENGDLSLRDFVRQVARSDAFRRRYWSGLYICKAIEVMHRRILGRPTFGRWEIDAYFDVAARKGFYGVVDAMVNSGEYNDCFGEDTVPYERFITPTDLSTRRMPALKRPFNATAYTDTTPKIRPDATQRQTFRGSGSLTPRNLQSRPIEVRGQWRASLTGGETLPSASDTASVTPFRPSAPIRSWAAPRWQADAASAPRRSSDTTGAALQPGAAMAMALQPGPLKGFAKRQSLGPVVCLSRNPSDAELTEAIAAVYRQLLGRQPLESEQLVNAESQLREGTLCVAEFVAQVAQSDLFFSRLNRMVPFKAASAAYLALLGRAAQPAETSAFLATRGASGLNRALAMVLDSPEYSLRFGRDTVPHLMGMATNDGLPLISVNRTAALYGGNAALNPG
jgi:phycobilisome core-membrane linker protein